MACYEYKGVKYTKDELIDLFQKEGSKTRRILELQSDLFQKGREDKNLITYSRSDEEKLAIAISARDYHVGTEFQVDGVTFYIDDGDARDYKALGYSSMREFEDANLICVVNKETGKRGYLSPLKLSRRILEQKSIKDAVRDRERKNDFLQLLNKENNWVTFFVKSIIQDSAKKGYENVRFPGGNTANKIEGQQTLEGFIKQKEDRIEQLNNSRFGWKFKKDVGNESISNQTLRSTKEEVEKELDNYPPDIRETIEIVEFNVDRELNQIKQELKDAREGKGKFLIIANFYENTVHNILKKQGYKPQEVTDEHGNKWFEIQLLENRDLGEFYFQISGTNDLVNKIREKDVNISKRGNEYEVNGNKIKRTVQKEVEDYYESRIGKVRAEAFFKDFRRETESKVQVDIKDIIDRRVDDNGVIRQAPLAQTNPSAVDPNDNTFYQTLDSHIEQRLSSYEPGTIFLNSPNLYDGRTAGTPDLLAITPDGHIDILQFKAVEAARTGDVKVFQQQAYNTEIEAFRRILEKGYGVKRQNFRFTRAIPIKTEYEPIVPGFKEKRLSNITVGNTNVSLIRDESLFPIPSKSETTGNKKFDSYINRLKALAQSEAAERVPPEKRLEKAQRIASLVASIKKLQVRKDASGVLASSKAVIKAQKERYKSLQAKISNTDPNVASIRELNSIANDILDDKDQVQVYTDMYQVFKAIFDDNTVESQDILEEARDVSEDARDIADQYLDLAIQFRIHKFAAKVGIKDEFDPEKRITFYRRMVRSLSQSPLKAGAELWKLVERINNKFKLQFLDRLNELEQIEEKVSKWLEGKSINDLYHKIFQYDTQGRWNGRVIQKFSKDFYKELEKAQENRDMKWIRENIDIDAYNSWMKDEHQKMIDNSKTARVHENDAENKRLIQQQLQEFADTFNINFPKGISTKNDKLKNFPLETNWKSDAYKELEKEENSPLLELYKHWEKRLKESWESGMFHEYVGKDWFPNVRRGFLEKISTAKAGGKLSSLLGNIRIESEDQVFGKIDPLSGKPVDEINVLFIRDLGEQVQDTDGNYFRDYSAKSMDIFKVLGLWDKEIIQYQLKTESEAIARLLHYTEANKGILPTTPTGKLLRSRETGEPLEPIEDETNAKYLKEHLDAVYYGKRMSNEFDIAFNIPYKSAVEKINKLFGKEILTVPEEESIRVSGVKLVGAMNKYFVNKTLGLNLGTSFAQIFGGTSNVLINQGRYFNKKDIAEAEIKYVSNKFWTDEQDKKLAGLIGYIHPFLEDRTTHELRKLSVSGWVKHLSSDHLFFLQRGADNWVNTIVGISMIKNTMVHDGKLVNIREFARQELGHDTKFQGTYEDSKNFDERLEKRVEELKKSPEALINYAKIEDDKIVLDGINRDSDTMIRLRQSILEIIKDALGNVSSEDLSLYKRSIVGQSFFMFKNWIPRMADVRFGSLKYQPGTDKYEYGRVRMLWNAVLSKNRSSIGGLLKLLTVNNSESLVEVAKKEYERKKDDFNKELDNLDMSEAEFVEMYIKGVRSEMREVLFAVSMLSILFAARAMEPDDNPEIKGAYKWSLKMLDKLTDELTFMYSPKSFTNILNGSVFPAVGILVEAQRFITDVILKLFYKTIGEDEKADRKKVSKDLFRMFPITKELVTYIAIFNNDMAKEYGIRINTQYGSIQ